MRKGTYLPNKPAAVWASSDRLTDGVIRSLTMILRTYGCRRCRDGQGCTMCGFIRDSAPTPPSPEDLVAQFEAAMARRPEGRFMVKIFTSGSFPDAAEMPPVAGLEILRRLDNDPEVTKVLLETRPEFVTSEAMADYRQAICKKLEVAIGVETSNDRIRSDCINKGFLFEDFVRASRIAHQHDTTVKAYLLLKPPFLAEGVAIRDIVKSARDVSPYAETISINLCNVQNGTFVEKLLRRGDYRPPWLWSAISVLRQAKTENPGMIITSDPVGAGSRHGPHNCGKCDSEVADAINKFSISQDIGDLRVKCDCKELWQKTVELEDISYGAPLVH
ncbi:MAG: archaeosine biosynthesis radical SAM protein RaSEA [Euryarchaeota archaeon]|nr:archaeosine biosynthesis radical SAM protein RaSEA [Euryarchaeota archaeon]